MEMELPKRPKQHISESVSLQLFTQTLPSEWVIRQLTERDYGVDCYVEIVNEKSQLTGQMFLTQLKSRRGIPWPQAGTFKLPLDISGINYWNQFQVPVFVFLADTESNEIFCISVKKYVRKNWDEYRLQKGMTFEFSKTDKYDHKKFLYEFNQDFRRNQFENELAFFGTNIHIYYEFINEHQGRDFHLMLDSSHLVFLESMYRNLHFLSDYLGVDWGIQSFKEIERNAKRRGNGYGEVIEEDAELLINHLAPKIPVLVERLQNFFMDEMSYWIIEHNNLFNYVNNIKEDGRLPD